MTKERQQAWWKRAAAVVGLMSLLCFWTASTAHVHSVAKQSGVQQECQLCLVSNTSHALQANIPTAVTSVLLFALLASWPGQPSIIRPPHSFPPRAPPTLA